MLIMRHFPGLIHGLGNNVVIYDDVPLYWDAWDTEVSGHDAFFCCYFSPGSEVTVRMM